MYSKRKLLLASYHVCLLLAVTYSRLWSAPATAEFLLINPDVRSSGAGGNSLIATRGEPSSIFLNPSLSISDGKTTKISAGYTAWTQNTVFGQTSGLIPLNGNNPSSVIGVGILYLGASGIEQRDETGAVKEGDASISNTAALLTYARKFSDRINLGASVKFVSLDYAGQVAQSIMLDLGASLYIASDRKTSLALSALNIGADINSQKTPLDFRLGLSRKFTDSFDISLEAEYPVHLAILKPKLGAEYNYFNYEKNKTFAVRAGGEILKGGEPALSAGAGFKTPLGNKNTDEGETLIKENTLGILMPFNLSLDYSFTIFTSNELTPAHRISVGIEF